MPDFRREEEQDYDPMSIKKPVLIIVNGLPGTGKTTLARRIASDTGLPVFSRDRLYETLFDELACQSNGCPPLLGQAAFALHYSIAGSILAAGQSLIIEQFFGNREMLLKGTLQPLALGGQLTEIDTTTPHSYNYADLLRQIHAALP
jgi:hypothetical protein